MPRIRWVLIALAGVLGVGAMPAAAAALGSWKRITNAGVMNTTEVGLARTADGILHVAWSRQSGTTEGIDLVPISAGGSIGATQRAVWGWISTENPALGLAPDGSLQLFFGGVHTLARTDPNVDENLASSTDGGRSWTITRADVVAPPDSAFSSPAAVSNSFLAQSTPLEAWTGTSGVWVHSGIGRSSRNANFQSRLDGCCGFYANLASDSSDHTELAWYSDANGHNGVWAQGVSAKGAPLGSPSRMPNTDDLGVGELQRTPLVARPQGGFYVAYPVGYPSFTGVELWRVGGAAIRVPGVKDPTEAGEAVDPAGRIWVFWVSQSVDAGPELYATRSNPTVTGFGPVVKVGAPTDTGSVFSVDGDATAGALDLVATLAPSNDSSASIWTRHIYPG